MQHRIESDPIRGQSFTMANKDWRKGTYDKFQQHVSHQLDPEAEEEDAGSGSDKEQGPLFVFQATEAGYPLLPDMVDKPLVMVKRTIRAYFTQTYSKPFFLSMYMV